MKLLHTFATAFLCAAAAAAQAQPVPERLEIQSLLDADALRAIQQCNPDLSTKTLEDHIEKVRRSDPEALRGGIFGRRGATRVVASVGTAWTCIAFSPNGYALLPPDALRNTVSTTGATQAGLAAWRRDMLTELSRTGLARGLIQTAAGGAWVVYYTIAKESAMSVDYEAKFLKAGEFNPADYRIVLAEPGIQSVSVTSWGSNQAKTKIIPSSQLLRLPATDGFVQISGSAATAAATFGSTVWRAESLAQQSAPELRLEKDGVAIFRSATSSQIGEWRQAGNVLRVKVGSVHHSLALSPDGRFLDGQSRRIDSPLPNIPGAPSRIENDDVDREFRYTAPRFYRDGDTEYEKVVATKREEAAVRERQRFQELLASIDRRKAEILAESPEAEADEQNKVFTRNGKMEFNWRVCDSNQQAAVFIARMGSNTSSAQGPSAGEICYSWMGTRKNWKETILKEGCRNRCSVF